MNFWEENKLFVIVAGVIAVVSLFLWPSCIGEWLAPWRGPVVTRLERKKYGDIERKRRSIKDKLKTLYPRKGNVVPVAVATEDAIKGNQVLLGNYGGMHRWMSFIPRFPFRIPERRKDENERQRYVSLAYTYARTGEFPCTEFEVRDPADGAVWLASTRNIRLGDPYFGLRNMELPDEIEDPDTRIVQVALVHELAHLALRAGVDEIGSIAPDEPYAWGVDGIQVATAYPVSVRVKCDLATLLRFIHALDGAHGRVTEVHDLGVAVEAAAPVAPAPKPRPAPADDPDENAPAPPAPPARDTKATRLVVALHGKPSIFAPDQARGDLKERLTIFRPAADDPHQLVFVANAVVRRVRPGGKAASELEQVLVDAELEQTSDLCFVHDGQPVRNTVREGDCVATRFFLVRSMKVKSVEATIEKDKDGFPANVTPAHLEADISVAALRFVKLKLPEAEAKVKTASAAKQATPGGRTYKKRGRRH